MRTVAEEWELLEKVVIQGGDYSEAEQREMKRSFYSGWLSALTTMLAIVGNDKLDRNTGAKEMENLYTEVMQFFAHTFTHSMAEVHEKLAKSK